MPADAYEIFLKRFGSFTEIQDATFETIESGKNCTISAPTGSGKTEAAILPIFNRLAKSGSSKGIQLIYITPLRALNRDLMKRLELLAKELGISISVRHGDTPTKERQLQAANPPQVLITTPETLQNLFLSARLRNALANVKAVVVDELHELYSNKRGAQLSVALERLAELSQNYQRVGISATMGNAEEAARFLCGERECKIIDAKTEKEIRVSIEIPQIPTAAYSEFREKFSLDAETLARIERISALIKESNSTLIFANTRQVVESLGSKLLYFNKSWPFGSIGVHHSSLDRDERIKVENEFKEGKVKSIIATSSLELGIDIGAVNLVVQYGSPRRVTRLIQRVGRGGHREKMVSYGKIIVANYLEALESLSVTKLMARGSVEKAAIEENALDVLGNQICAMCLEYKKLGVERIYQIVKRAAPFSKLKKQEFESVLHFLDEQRLIHLKDEFAAIGYRSRPYFFTNISVIPDAIRFAVKNTATNKIISSLDEEFASNYLEEGAVFITKGLPWKVISIEKETIFVEPSPEVEAAIPDWEGEDIPVSYDTAQEVYLLIKEGVPDKEEVLEKNAREKTLKFIESQKKYFSPENKTVVIEELEGYAVVHLALGKQANELIGKILGAVASQASGSRVMVRATPYALVVDFGGVRRRPDIKKVFENIKNYNIPNALDAGGFLIGTDIFRYKFIQVSKLFGVVEKKATVTKNSADRLISFYKDSPIMEETIRDLKKNYFDVEAVSNFIEHLKKNAVEIKHFEGTLSPLGEEILRATYYYRELLLPTLPSEATINEFENKISEKKMRVVCTYCGLEFARQVDAGKDETISCPRCKSPMVAVFDEDKADAIRKKISGKHLAEPAHRQYREALREASLVEAYGSRALAALAIYGVGTTTAARVLKLLRKDYKQFIVDLIEAQKNFVRTKKYWK